MKIFLFLSRRCPGVPSYTISDPPSLFCRIQPKTIYLKINIQNRNGSLNADETALADTGASGLFIDERYANYMKMERRILDEPLEVYNVDGTLNKKGTITHYTRILLSLGGRSTWEIFYITNLGYQRIILGFPWFKKHNPDIDWSTGRIQWRIPSPISPKKKKHWSSPNPMTEPDNISKERIEDILHRNQLTQFINWVSPNDQYLFDPTSEDLFPDWIKPRSTETKDESKQETPLEETIPKEYHKWIRLFDKKASDRFPISRPWDHKIDLKPGLNRRKGRHIILPKKKILNFKSSLKNSWTKDISDPANQNRRLPSFL